jgi:hypothetical protein
MFLTRFTTKIYLIINLMDRLGAVVRVVSLSHQVTDSKLFVFVGKDLPRFIPFPHTTHVGASGTGSAILLILP